MYLSHPRSHNQKLGPGIVTMSRPVGPTCPSSCKLLGNGCYAQRMSTQGVAAKIIARAWDRNLTADYKSLAQELVNRKMIALRLHVGGDFGLFDKLDRSYLANVFKAIHKARQMGFSKPIWAYTHMWLQLASHRKWFARLGIELFASVDSIQDGIHAARLGYRVAYSAMDNLAIAKSDAIRCPEQTGAIFDCSSCGWCFKYRTKKGVVFRKH